MHTLPLKYFFEHRDRHGNWRMYARRKGVGMIRLHATPGTPEFLPEYQAALALLDGRRTAALAIAVPPAHTPVQAPALPGSLAWLCQRYYASGEFKTLDASTQRVRRSILERVCQGHEDADGRKPYRLLEPQHIATRRDAHVEYPEAANAIVKALRQVFAWAVLPHVKLADRNPARDVPYLRPNNPDGHHTWTTGELERFVTRHPLGTKAHLALALLFFTGVRIGDVVRLGRQMVREGWLHFTEAKGARREPKRRELPITPALQVAIEAAPGGNLNYLVTEFGKPFTVAGFGNWFRKRCDEAGLGHCSAHGLRKAGATIAADNGATEHQLMAIFGWASPKQAALYTRKANRRKLVSESIHLIEPAPPAAAVPPSCASQNRPDMASVAARIGNKSESPLPVMGSGDSLSGKKVKRIKGG